MATSAHVIAIAMVKDEADIVGFTVPRMLEQVDEVLVADNGSTDGTREILEQLDVTVVDDPEVGYYQARKISVLAARAAEVGADYVIPFDADEVWYSPFGRIADVLAEASAAVVRAELYDHVPTAQDAGDADPVRRMGWRRAEPAPLAKVACRPTLPVAIAQGNHAASYPGVDDSLGGLVVRHFPYRSAEQFVRKARNGAAAYAATDLPAEQGAHWRRYGELLEAHGPDALADVFRAWFWSAAPELDAGLIFDPCP